MNDLSYRQENIRSKLINCRYADGEEVAEKRVQRPTSFLLSKKLNVERFYFLSIFPSGKRIANKSLSHNRNHYNGI